MTYYWNRDIYSSFQSHRRISSSYVALSRPFACLPFQPRVFFLNHRRISFVRLNASHSSIYRIVFTIQFILDYKIIVTAAIDKRERLYNALINKVHHTYPLSHPCDIHFADDIIYFSSCTRHCPLISAFVEHYYTRSKALECPDKRDSRLKR